MMRLSTVVFALVLALPTLGEAKDYVAPDGKLTAKVMTRSQKDCEAVILIEKRAHVLAKEKHQSDDHQHGMCVDKAGWTADSQFFVFSLYSSGGHQPWHTPIMFFSKRLGRIVPLEHFVAGAITESKFELSSPDVIEFTTTEFPIDTSPSKLRKLSLGILSRMDPKHPQHP